MVKNNKLLIIVILLISLVFISACDNFGKVYLSNLSEGDVDKVIKCDKPYMRFASGCCLDQNDNKICDNDEKEIVQKSADNVTQKVEETTESLDCSEFILSVSEIIWNTGTLEFDVNNLGDGNSFILIKVSQQGADDFTKKLYLQDHKVTFKEFFPQGMGNYPKMDKPITIRVNLIDENENPVCSPILESWSRETESYQ